MPRSPIPLHHVEHNPGGAGPVVLLHGFPLVGAMWDELVPALADRYRLIVPDLRGHGQSEAPQGPYEMADYAGDVLALLDSLDVASTTVVGLSMGGYITMQVLAAAPERVRAVVLADTTGQADTDERRAARAAQVEVIRADGLRAFSEMVLPRMFAPGTFDERPELVERFRQIIVSQRPHAVIAALQGLASRPEMLGPLAAVTCPTLVMVGEHDSATTPEQARELTTVIRGSGLVVLSGAGHMSNWEQPDAFNVAVRDFLDRALSSKK